MDITLWYWINLARLLTNTSWGRIGRIILYLIKHIQMNYLVCWTPLQLHILLIGSKLIR